MPDTPLPARAARYAALAPTERETLVTELLAEVEQVTAERDRLLTFLVGFANAKQGFDVYGPTRAPGAMHEKCWWAFDGSHWVDGDTPLEAVRKAAGLDTPALPRVSIVDTLEALRDAGGKAWDNVGDVEGYLGREERP